MDSDQIKRNNALRKMVEESRLNAPKINPSVDFRTIIDQMYDKEMKYFDTDVLINSYINQNVTKHSFS